MNQSLFLSQLQKIDSENDFCIKRIAEINLILSSNQEIQEAKKELDASLKKMELIKKRIKEIASKIEVKRLKKEQSEASLYNGKIQNPKELQNLETEIALLKKSIESLEEQQLAEMILLEEVETECKNFETNLDHVQAKVIREQASFNGEKDDLSKKIESLAKEKTMISEHLSPESLTLYHKLRQTKRGIAVSPIIENSCSICGATLTPAECQAAKLPTNLMLCKNCGRILFSG